MKKLRFKVDCIECCQRFKATKDDVVIVKVGKVLPIEQRAVVCPYCGTPNLLGENYVIMEEKK